MRVVSFTLNGKATRLTVDETRMLLWVLRDDLGLAGTKFGCGQALCGACTVLVNNAAVRSCATPVGEVEGKQVVTIEGSRSAAAPAQEARETPGSSGYCTPGMIRRAPCCTKTRPTARKSSSTWTTTSAGAARTAASSRPWKPRRRR
jgi:isoquinoline 1-oxidoreductase alpha subunit